MEKPLQCTWCMRPSNPPVCEHCGNAAHLRDPNKPHTPEWSRCTWNTVECKICGRKIPFEEHGRADDICPGGRPSPSESIPL